MNYAKAKKRLLLKWLFMWWICCYILYYIVIYAVMAFSQYMPLIPILILGWLGLNMKGEKIVKKRLFPNNFSDSTLQKSAICIWDYDNMLLRTRGINYFSILYFISVNNLRMLPLETFFIKTHLSYSKQQYGEKRQSCGSNGLQQRHWKSHSVIVCKVKWIFCSSH